MHSWGKNRGIIETGHSLSKIGPMLVALYNLGNNEKREEKLSLKGGRLKIKA